MILDTVIVDAVKQGKMYGLPFPKKYKMRGFKPSKTFLIKHLVETYLYDVSEAKKMAFSDKYKDLVICKPLN